MKILLTGATGFIGSALYPVLVKQDHRVTKVLRKQGFHGEDLLASSDQTYYIDSLNNMTDFADSLDNIDVVIHLAGQAHMPLNEGDDTDLHHQCLEVNYYGTMNLAQQAARKKVRRFIFISSITVHGESGKKKEKITEASHTNPYDTYTSSKVKAELSLRKIEKETGMEVVILRPPLVYGPGAKANFLKLLKLVHTGLPLPFAGVRNNRSFLFIDNLVDAITCCATHERAGGHTFIVSDGQPLSTPQLLDKISTAMGSRTRLFNFPVPFLKCIMVLLGQKKIYDRLCENLFVDSAQIHRILGWQPKVSIDDGIMKTIQWYLEQKNQQSHL